MKRKVIEKHVEVSLCETPISVDYKEVPEITAKDYLDRIDNLWRMPQAQKYTTIVIYGDREHFSNIYYFTGYDPRFEEALLILKKDHTPIILVGNEGMGYAEKIPYNIVKVLYQFFGLMGQSTSQSQPLEDIFRRYITEAEEKVGLIGWKYYKEEVFRINGCITDVPSYLVETLACVVGRKSIFNATDLLMNSDYGLRHYASAKEIIQFEVLGTKISRGVYNTIKNLREGIKEVEASSLLQIDGEPLCTHPNLNFGDEHVSLGLNSPQYNMELKYGMPVGVGYGMRGSNVHKAGMYIRSIRDLPQGREHYLEEMVKPYFLSIATWYEMMKIGTKFSDIYEMVEEQLDLEKFNIILNPGHLIHTDEWTHSPFDKSSNIKVHSGHVLQCDYTVSFKSPYLVCHIEDGLAIGNEALHKEIRSLAPLCYERIIRRKAFMKEVLNIQLPDEVLPLSDLPAICFPYMADVSVVLALEEVSK